MMMPGLMMMSMVLGMAPATAAVLKVPGCDQLKAWSSTLIVPTRGAKNDSGAIAQSIQTLWSDPRTTQTFDKPYSQWSDKDLGDVRNQARSCQQALSAQDPDAARKLSYALDRAPSRQPQAAGPAMVVTIQKPDCLRVTTWAHRAGAAPDGTSLEKRQTNLFSDHSTKDLFGVAFSQWTFFDMYKGRAYVVDCRTAAFPRGSKLATPEARETYAGYQAAESYLGNAMKRHEMYSTVSTKQLRQLD